MPTPLLKSMAQKYRIPLDTVERYWERAKQIIGQRHDPGSPEYYPMVVAVLKRILRAKYGT